MSQSSSSSSAASSSSSSITKTAYDALLAKVSALSVGGHSPVKTNSNAYSNLLEQMIDGSSSYTENENATTTTTTPQQKTIKQQQQQQQQPKRQRHKQRQQIPLVNAGYAARIACMTCMIEKFVSYHQTASLVQQSQSSQSPKTTKTKTTINLVMLGCGLDVLGMWGSSLVEPDFNIMVYEIDCPEICYTKRDILVSKGLLRPSSSSSSSSKIEESSKLEKNGMMMVVAQGLLDLTSSNGDDGGVVVEGNNSSSKKNDEEESGHYNYVLICSDLRTISSSSSLLSTLIDTSCPTLVISELVLAYLGCQGTDNLLQYCATQLCKTNSGSCFVAYEPLGPTVVSNQPQQQQNHHTSSSPRVLSVTDGYKRSYMNQFKLKLQRGQQTKKEDDDNNDNANVSIDDDKVFHPLASSCSKVEERFNLAGFSSSCACYAGTMASIATSSPNDDASLHHHHRKDVNKREKEKEDLFPLTEPFDEYVDLTLHLRSYAVVCAFASNETDIKLKHQLCPWYDHDDSHLSNIMADDGNIKLSTIEKHDQERVRELFRETYEELFDTYPAVKKMVKTALKSDLSGKMDVCTNSNAMNLNNIDESSSSIGNRYKDWGGIFIVATDESNSNSNGASSNETTNTTTRHRRVVGCVGLRPCKKSEGNIRSSSPNSSFEIRRLAVDATCRGKGIGKALLSALHHFIALKNKTRRRRSKRRDTALAAYNLIATTPDVLVAANQLYQSSGFDLVEEVNMGKMKMNTYMYTTQS